MKVIVLGLIMSLSLLQQTKANEPLKLYAAGSLRLALTEVASDYEKTTKQNVQLRFGASGLLLEAIKGGEKPDIFASANMAHPQSLTANGLAAPVQKFARNALCAFVKKEIEATYDTLLAVMLQPNIKLGTSTPKADPAGDYAFEVFAKAEKIVAGSKNKLETKSLQLTGGANSPQPPANSNVYAMMLNNGSADIFLAYCSNGEAIAKEAPSVRLINLPPDLQVGADYGITSLLTAKPQAKNFIDFLLSDKGQSILIKNGFANP